MLVEHCMLLGVQHMLRVVQHMCDSVRLKLSQLPTKLKLKLSLAKEKKKNHFYKATLPRSDFARNTKGQIQVMAKRHTIETVNDSAG